MIYVALLRGINVGGNRKVEMAKLKLTFERLGFRNVKTFIASGNVIFGADTTSEARLTRHIEAAIEQDFGFHVDVLLRDLPAIEKLVKALPADWANDQATRCDVMFLWAAADSPEALARLAATPEIETVTYFPGAILWHIDRVHVTKSRIPRMIGTSFYKQVTIRNLSTVRKIYELMQAASAGK